MKAKSKKELINYVTLARNTVVQKRANRNSSLHKIVSQFHPFPPSDPIPLRSILMVSSHPLLDF